MQSQYKLIRDAYYSINDYSIESIKKLPYEDGREYTSSFLLIETDSYISHFKRLVRMIESENYMGYIDAGRIFYTNAKKYKLDKKMQNNFIKEFSQFSLIADKLGIDYAPLSTRLNNLNSHIDSSLYFLNDIVNFYRDYNMISSFMKNSLSHPAEMSAYEEEIAELKNKYNSIYYNIQNFEDFDIRSFTNICIDSFEAIKKEIIEKIVEVDCSKIYTQAQLYAKEKQEVLGDVSTFLVDKNFEECINTKITLTNAQKIQEYILFEDKSVTVKQNGKYHSVENKVQYYMALGDLEKSLIQYQLRKKPKLAKIISDMYDEHGEVNTVLIVIDTFLKNEQILKNMKMDIDVFNHKSFEAIDDYMNGLISTHKLHQYANSILSNKNKDLLTESALESFKILKESGVSKDSLQDMIGKKLSALKTPEEFENYLVKIINHFSEFNKERLTEKLLYVNIQPVYDENNVVVFQIDNFEQSKMLGSPSWCISRDLHYYNSYTEDNAKQYFMYDFNRNEKDNQSMIGFTIYKDGTMSTQHAKNDDYHPVDDYLKAIINKVLYKEQNIYELPEDKISELQTMFESKDNKKLKVKIA